MMPSHPPERPLAEGFEWDLKHLELCDRLGFAEAWLGEHFCSPWEPNPAPDLLIAQGLLRTSRMKLAPMSSSGGFGTMLVLTFDFSEEHEAWATSQQLLIDEVLPQFRQRAAA